MVQVKLTEQKHLSPKQESGAKQSCYFCLVFLENQSFCEDCKLEMSTCCCWASFSQYFSQRTAMSLFLYSSIPPSVGFMYMYVYVIFFWIQLYCRQNMKTIIHKTPKACVNQCFRYVPEVENLFPSNQIWCSHILCFTNI